MLGPALPTHGLRRSGYETIAGDQSENRRKREVMEKLVFFFIISFSVTHIFKNICNIFSNVRAEGSVSEGRKSGRVPSHKKSTLSGHMQNLRESATKGIFIFLFNIKYKLAVCLKLKNSSHQSWYT